MNCVRQFLIFPVVGLRYSFHLKRNVDAVRGQHDSFAVLQTMHINEQGSLSPLVIVVDDDLSIYLSIRRIGLAEGFQTQSFPRVPSRQEMEDAGLVVDGRPCCIVFEASHAAELSNLSDHATFAWHSGLCLCRNAHLPSALGTAMTAPFVFVEKPFGIAMFTELLRQSINAGQAMAGDDSMLSRRIEALTQREREVYRQISQGRSGKEIADHLGISTKTFYVHRGNMMRKIGTRTAAELARLCALHLIGRHPQSNQSCKTGA